MTSSREAVPALLQRLRDGLDTERLQQIVDARLTAALSTWPAVATGPRSTPEFHELVAAFVQWLQAHGLQPAWHLSRTEALAEALALIENGYPTEGAPRYDAAHFDACDPEGAGVARVLEFLLESIRAEARRKALLWAVADVVGGLDWPTRCALVETLRSNAPHLLAGRLGTLTTVELAPVVVLLAGGDVDLSPHDKRALDWLGF